MASASADWIPSTTQDFRHPPSSSYPPDMRRRRDVQEARVQEVLRDARLGLRRMLRRLLEDHPRGRAQPYRIHVRLPPS